MKIHILHFVRQVIRVRRYKLLHANPAVEISLIVDSFFDRRKDGFHIKTDDRDLWKQMIRKQETDDRDLWKYF